MADPKLVTPDLTELERLKAAASEVCSHDPRYDGCPKCVAFEAYDEALHAAAGSLIQAARRLGELEAYCASLRERAESERGSAEHRLLVNADLQRQLTTANARIAELEDEAKRASAEGAKAERAKVVAWLDHEVQMRAEHACTNLLSCPGCAEVRTLNDARVRLERGEHDDG